MKRKKRGIFKKILTFLFIALAVCLVILYVLKKKQDDGTATSRESAMLQTKDSTAEVTKGTISLTTEGSGSVEAAQQTAVKADYTVTIEEVKAENGDRVEAGDLIATVDEDSVQAQIDAVQQQIDQLNTSISNIPDDGSDTLTAPVSGRVKRIFVEEGDLITDVVKKKGGLMEIAADRQLKVNFTAENTGVALKQGQDVVVRFICDEEEYEEDGILTEEKDGTWTAYIDDSYDYDVDTEASVYIEAEEEDGESSDEAKDTLIGKGILLSGHPYLVTGDYGVVDEIYPELNERVDAGNTLLTRTNVRYNAEYLDLLDQREEQMEKLQELRSLLNDPSLYAPQSGIVTSMVLTDGGQAAEKQPMYTLISTESYELKAQIDELDIAGVKAGQKAKVVFDALDDQEFDGTVEKVSAIGNNTNGVTTFTVTLSIPGDEQIKTAMSATATIVTDTKEDALLVPVDAIQTGEDGKFVSVVAEDGTITDKYVTLGLVNNTQAEVTEGVSEGDKVVVIGTSEMEEMINMMRAGRQSGSDSRSSGGEN